MCNRQHISHDWRKKKYDSMHKVLLKEVCAMNWTITHGCRRKTVFDLMYTVLKKDACATNWTITHVLAKWTPCATQHTVVLKQLFVMTWTISHITFECIMYNLEQSVVLANRVRYIYHHRQLHLRSRVWSCSHDFNSRKFFRLHADLSYTRRTKYLKHT